MATHILGWFFVLSLLAEQILYQSNFIYPYRLGVPVWTLHIKRYKLDDCYIAMHGIIGVYKPKYSNEIFLSAKYHLWQVGIQVLIAQVKFNDNVIVVMRIGWFMVILFICILYAILDSIHYHPLKALFGLLWLILFFVFNIYQFLKQYKQGMNKLLGGL